MFPTAVRLLLAVVTFLLSTTPTIAQSFCSICGKGRLVGSPDVVLEDQFNFPEIYTCGELETKAEEGFIYDELCGVFPRIVNEVCACYIAPTLSPAPSSSPTDTLSPTDIPTVIPTNTPTATTNPTSIATSMPTRNPTIKPPSQPPIRWTRSPSNPPTYAPPPTISAQPPTTRPLYVREDEDEDKNRIGIGLAVFAIVAASIALLWCWYCNPWSSPTSQQGGRTSTGVLTTIAPAAPTQHTTDNNSNSAETVVTKLRPRVLAALFPEQKAGTNNRSTRSSQAKQCSICLDAIDEDDSAVFGSSCAHIYHRACILEWLNNKNVKNRKYHDDCPNCRQPMWDAETYQIVQDDLVANGRRTLDNEQNNRVDETLGQWNSPEMEV